MTTEISTYYKANRDMDFRTICFRTSRLVVDLHFAWFECICVAKIEFRRRNGGLLVDSIVYLLLIRTYSCIITNYSERYDSH